MRESAELAKAALHNGRHGSLAVLDAEGGGPYAALVNYACDGASLPIFLFSGLARHTHCLLKDHRASLLVAEIPAEGDALSGLRVSFSGTMARIEASEVKAAYIAKHPYAASYAEFGDFGFWKLQPDFVHLVAGFGRIETLKSEDVF